MTPEAQRIAIAEACGWKDKGEKWEGYFIWISPHGSVNYGQENNRISCLPDYLNDLNAMHEAEKVLPYDQQPFFANHLTDILRKDGVGPLIFDMVHATAPQRAEAFLRTLGKWKE